MSDSLRLDVSLEGYRDIDKVEASFQSLLGTMKQAETEHAQLSSAFKTLSNTVSRDYVTAVGKLAAAKGQLIKTTAHGNSNEAKWAKSINTSVKVMREQAVAAKESLKSLDELVKLQVRADNITARQSNEITKLSNRYAELTSSQASQIARLKELNSIKEAELRTDAKSHTLNLRQTQQVREQTLALNSLRTAKALEIATLKEQQKEQQRVNQTVAQAQAGTDRYSVSVRKTAEDLRYYTSSQGQAALRDQEKLKNVKQLVVEEEKRSQQMAKMARELERLKNGEESAKYALEARLRAAREAARAEAELATGTGKASRASKEAVSQLQRHQLELKKLRETSAFYQSAQGKEILQIQRRIQSEKQLQKVMAETHIKNRFLAQSVSLLSGRSLLATQATAGMRASLAGLNTSFGMYTSSTILFATAMYTLSSAIRNAITSGAEFEAQMDRVTAVMDSSGGMAQYMTGEVREIARVTVFTANEVAEGLMQLGMAGLNTKDAMIALEPSLRLASIGMLDMGTTADIVTNIMMGMNLDMKKLPHVVDDMATAITNSNMTIEQLGSAMSYVAPLTRDADISVQEIIGTLEVLHNTGIKASRAGTAMRTSILAMLAPTAKAWNVLEKYNITVDDHTGRMRNWTELLGDLAAANLNLADVENLVGKRQAAAFKAMIDSMKATERVKVGTDKYSKALYEQNTKLKESVKRLRENAGAAQVMQAVMEDNLRGDWLKLISAIQDKFLEFYDSNADGMREMVQSITQFVNELDVGRIDEFFSSTIYWIEKLVPLMVGMKAAGMVHSVTSGVANTLALIPHPAARVASGVLGAGAGIAGGVAGYMAYNAVSGGIDWAKQQASPDGLDNVERRTGAYRHTYGKSADELRQLYHSYAKSLEIIEVQKAELEDEFADNGNLEEYTRKLDSLNTAAGNITNQWQRLNQVMDASTIAPTEVAGNQAIQDIDARLVQLDEARQRLETAGKVASQEYYDSFGQFHKTKRFGTVTQQSVLSDLPSDVTARTSLAADLGWASVSNAERETYAKALQESLKSALINLDPSKVGLDQFMADIKRQIEDAPGSEFIKIKDEDAVLAGFKAYYEMQERVMDNDSERNHLLKERSDLQGQINQGIKTEAELQAMLYGKDAEAGIDRVKKTTEEYRKSAAELYRLNATSEQLAENQKNLLELERNIAAAYKEVVDAEAARAKDPDAEVKIAASAMEQEKWTEAALKLRTEDLKLRQSLIQAAEKEAEATRNSTIALQEQVNLQRGLIAARMSIGDSDFDQSRITHINAQNKLIEEQMELREQVISLAAADVTDKESLKLHYAQLEPLAERLKLLQSQVALNDEFYHQQAALKAMDSRDAQKAKLESMQDEIKLQERTLELQKDGYWYTAAERAQREMLVSQYDEHLDKLKEQLDKEKAIAGTLPETLTAREDEIKLVEKIIKLLKDKAFYPTAEEIALNNTKRIYESMYQGMESATISLLESGLKDTESFFDSIVDSFKRMLAEMAYQAAIKPIVVQTMAKMMPGESGAEFMKNQGVEAGTGIGAGGWVSLAAVAVVGAVNHHNKKDEERMRKFTAEYRQERQSLGTVLGDANAKSDSIVNLTEHVLSINQAQFNVGREMLGALRKIDHSLQLAAAGAARALGEGGLLSEDGLHTSWKQTDNDKALGVSGGASAGAGAGMYVGTYVFPGIGTAVGGIVGGVVGGILGGLGAFGTKQSVSDAGIYFDEQSLGEINAGGLSASGYQDVKTTKKRMWIKSSSNERHYQSLGDDTLNPLGSALSQTGAVLGMVAKELAMTFDDGATSIHGYIAQLKVLETELSLKGLEGAALQAEIQSWLSSTTDAWTEQMFGDAGLGGWLEQYQRVGEGMLETGGRVVVESQAWQAMAARLGMSMTATGVKGVELSQDLIAVSGGLEQLIANAQSFYENFFSDAEKQANLTNELAEVMADMNLAIPTSRAEFKALVQELEAGDLAAQETAAALLELNPQLHAFYGAIEALLGQAFDKQIKLYGLLGRHTEALVMTRQKELEGMDEQLHGVQRHIWLLEDMANAQAAAEQQQIDLNNAMRDAQADLAGFTRSIQDYLASLRGSTAGMGSPQDIFANTQTDFRSELTAAQGGDRTAMDNITNYADRYLEAAKAMYGSGAAAQGVLGEITGALTELPKRLTAEEFLAEEFRKIMNQEFPHTMNELINATTYELAALIDFAVYDEKIPADIRAILYDFVDSTQKTIDYIIKADWLDQDFKNLAAGETFVASATVHAALQPNTPLGIQELILDKSKNFMAHIQSIAAGNYADDEARELMTSAGNMYRTAVLTAALDINSLTEYERNLLETDPKAFIRRMQADTTGLTDWQKNLLQAVGGDVNAKMDLSAILDSTDSNYLKQIAANTMAALGERSADVLLKRYNETLAEYQSTQQQEQQRQAQLAQYASVSDYQNTINSLQKQYDAAVTEVQHKEAIMRREKRYEFADPVYMSTLQGLIDAAKQQMGTLASQMAAANSALETVKSLQAQDRSGAIPGLKVQLEDLLISLWALGVDVASPFAKGGVFTNSVVNGPTPFNMGLMGEAGPEAIMPLHRGPDGSLGVRADVSSVDIESQVSLVVALNGIRNEIKSSSSKMEQRLQRLEEHAAASVKVQQHGFKGQIGAQQEANKELKKQASATRLESTK